MNPLIKKFQYGNHTVTLETGRVARQATGAVLCSIDDTTVLCTVVGAREAKAGMDFFPLGVHYIETPMLRVKSQAVFLSAKVGRMKKRL